MINRNSRQPKAALLTILPPTLSGGGERLAFYLKRLLEKKGYDVEVLSARQQPPQKRWIMDSVLAQLSLLRSTYFLGKAIERRQQEFDLVISFDFLGWNYHGRHTHNFNIYTGGAYVHKKVFPLWDFIKFAYEHYVFGGLARLSGRGKVCTAPAELARRDLKRHRKIECVVVQNGIDVYHFKKLAHKQDLRRKYQLPEDKFIGLFVGRWGNVVKGSDTLLELIRQTKAIHWLLVIGYGEMPEHLKRINNVTILKEVEYEKLPEIYSVADFIFVPSRYEGFCYVAVEALACELPVIACPAVIPSMHDIYQDRDLEPLSMAYPEDLDKAKRAIQLLLKDGDYRERIGKKARQGVMARYSVEIWEKNMTKVLLGE